MYTTLRIDLGLSCNICLYLFTLTISARMQREIMGENKSWSSHLFTREYVIKIYSISKSRFLYEAGVDNIHCQGCSNLSWGCSERFFPKGFSGSVLKCLYSLNIVYPLEHGQTDMIHAELSVTNRMSWVWHQLLLAVLKATQCHKRCCLNYEEVECFAASFLIDGILRCIAP